MCRWKNYENRSISSKDMDKEYSVSLFWLTVYILQSNGAQCRNISFLIFSGYNQICTKYSNLFSAITANQLIFGTYTLHFRKSATVRYVKDAAKITHRVKCDYTVIYRVATRLENLENLDRTRNLIRVVREKRKSQRKCVLAYGQLPRVFISTQNVQYRPTL